MVFNSIDFAVFLPIVFFAYWFIAGKSCIFQNLVIVAAGFVFYAWWDWRLLLLLSFSGIVDYLLAIQIDKASHRAGKNLFLSLSVISNLGILFVFKYFNFFIENFAAAFHFFGSGFSPASMKIIFTVGISFYIFKTLSYTIDVSRQKLKPTRNIIDYFAFLTFFPQLLAGPIDRATNLLPQFYTKRMFSYPFAVDGLKQIMWGLFKKIVIADNCARFANMIFDNSADYSGITLFVGALFFTIQIYADFSGYSDIAIGISRLFGFDTMRNFAFPYFSRDIAEFWRRWHISLSSWFNDYVFTPLSIRWRNMGYVGIGGALFLTFILCGLWHGPKWTYIVWGLINVAYFIPFLLLRRKKKVSDIVAKGKLLPTVAEVLQMGVTFIITVFAWIFFRAADLHHAMSYIKSMCTGFFDKASLVKVMDFVPGKTGYPVLLMIILFFAIEWMGREQQYATAGIMAGKPRMLRWGFYYLIVTFIFLFAGSNQQFIYFQF